MVNEFDEKEIQDIIKLVIKETNNALFIHKAEGFACRTKYEYNIIPKIIEKYVCKTTSAN